MIACYCGGHYRCEHCRLDVCYCACETDGAPQTRAETTAGYTHPAQPGIDAWANKMELTR